MHMLLYFLFILFLFVSRPTGVCAIVRVTFVVCVQSVKQSSIISCHHSLPEHLSRNSRTSSVRWRKHGTNTSWTISHSAMYVVTGDAFANCCWRLRTSASETGPNWQYYVQDDGNACTVYIVCNLQFFFVLFRSTSKSRPNNIRGGENVRSYVRPSVRTSVRSQKVS